MIRVMAKSEAKQLVITARQQGVVNHFAAFIKDEATRARYAELVFAELRALPSFSDFHVTLAAIHATTDCRK
jgi:hypothetical protein